MGSPKITRKLLQSKTLKCILLAAILLLLFVIFNISKPSIDNKALAGTYSDSDSNIVKTDSTDWTHYKFHGEKIVHLDLKGAPPRITYYTQLFPLLAKLGATGLLIEYEDMFPYTGELSNISAKNAYSLEDIHQINLLATKNNLQIIPLVQTFGHLGFLLKLSQYKHLREVEYPQVICPTHNETLPLLSAMIKQLLETHPNSKHIHIGCDEVFHIGVCNRCEEIIIKKQWSSFNLYLDHVKSLATFIRTLSKTVNVLIWDDILRNIDEEALKMSEINKFVTPVVWKYTPSIYSDIPMHIWDKYANVFESLWVASAFKGASGSNEIVTEPNYHIHNHKSWLQVVQDYNKMVTFKGFLITGWQRYDHFAVLCELLPMGIPTLMMCLGVLNGSNTSNAGNYQMLNYDFPGGNIVSDVIAVKNLQIEFHDLLKDSRVRGWMNDYNVKYKFSNPEYIAEISKPLEHLTMKLMLVKNSLHKNMLDVYDNYTVNEWMETYIDPLKNQMYDLWDRKEKLLEKMEWPRRPYTDEL